MQYRVGFAPVYAIAAAALALGSTACSSSGNGDGGSTSSGDMPSVHLEQTIVMLSGGRPQEEATYRQMLADCQAAGTPTTPVPAGDVAKIGRKKLVETIEAERASRRIDAWKVDATAPCQFRLVHSGEQEIQTADGKSYRIDLATNQGDVQDLGAPQPREAVDDGDLDAAARATGWKRGGESQVQGQRCESWTAPTGDRYCVWTGGTKWGFSRAGINALDGDGITSDGAIVLQATPPSTGFGWAVQTDSFTVGKAADESTFAVPSGARIAASD
ncbi:hypothetical protein [Luteibacter yeojuensis]|uniref:Lipoprotein n=1 Tax=Luteibacter yeojuensis TaxID=345309 RepID=A0A7X5QRB2_9GAMM|nr:hypothetical protein [Luteibacter yeojuensis]NID13987.1 hypothetical protein [Luteibacter yeojuensis]